MYIAIDTVSIVPDVNSLDIYLVVDVNRSWQRDTVDEIFN